METRPQIRTGRHGDPEELTALLNAWSEGDRDALDAVIPLVYDELKGLARAQLRRERSHRAPQTTALVHEAFLRLAHHPAVRWQSRRHFYAVAARAMRRLLVDLARRRGARKRGGDGVVSLEEIPEPRTSQDQWLAALDLSLADLYALDPVKAWIVELRYFGGFSIEETAEIVGSSRATVIRQWRVARAWLYRALGGDRFRTGRSRPGGARGSDGAP